MSDNLSQEDIDRLLAGGAAAASEEPPKNSPAQLEYLSDTEADTLGEIGNISMGSAATTLSMLLGNKVDITTPQVREYSQIEDVFQTPNDCVTVEILYKEGLDGCTLFTLQVLDTAIIADLMMGGDGKVSDPEIGELQMSAVGEAMNQMIGTASTSLASMFNTPIDISPPVVRRQKKGEKLDISQEIFGVPIVAVAFKLKVGDLIDSEIMEVMSLSSAQNKVSRLMNSMDTMMDEVSSSAEDSPAPPPPPAPSQPQPSRTQSPPPQPAQKPVTVQPVQFASFDDQPGIMGETNRNLDLVMDVKLKLTVELGRTELPIKKVLELTRGSVIELDKVAGEPVELLANGKLIAKGEVVVIEDNFGLRITSIISPDSRLKNI